MQISNLPTKIPLPFAASGTKNVIPTASQIGITPGAASLTDGFPPLTFTPLASGGVPPAGADFNGIFNLTTSSINWLNAGGGFPYDSAFSTAIGGYPQGAIIPRIDQTGFWLSQVDNNTSNPETGGANWVPAYNYGATAIAGLTNANVTLTALQASKTIITLAGTLTGNVQIILPTWIYSWQVVNNTTGAFTVTCKTASGTGVAVTQSTVTHIYGDGTNINQSAISQVSADARYTQKANNLSDVANAATSLANLSGASQVGTQEALYSAATAGGTADALTASFSPAITSTTLASGATILYVRAASANATTTPTFTPNSGTVTAATIYKGANQALVAGDISGAGHRLALVWDATLSKWCLLNPAYGVIQSSQIVPGSPVATTSGTAFDVTGIPATAKRITIMLKSVSTNAASTLLFQIGTSGGVQTTSYTAIGGSTVYTTGFGAPVLSGATDNATGVVTLSLLDASTGTWSVAASIGRDTTFTVIGMIGYKTLSGTLDRIRMTTLNGTDTFDAGSFSVMYEG